MEYYDEFDNNEFDNHDEFKVLVYSSIVNYITIIFGLSFYIKF